MRPVTRSRPVLPGALMDPAGRFPTPSHSLPELRP